MKGERNKGDIERGREKEDNYKCRWGFHTSAIVAYY